MTDLVLDTHIKISVEGQEGDRVSVTVWAFLLKSIFESGANTLFHRALPPCLLGVKRADSRYGSHKKSLMHTNISGICRPTRVSTKILTSTQLLRSSCLHQEAPFDLSHLHVKIGSLPSPCNNNKTSTLHRKHCCEYAIFHVFSALLRDNRFLRYTLKFFFFNLF